MPGLNKRASNQTGTISIKMEDINEKEKVTMFCTNPMLAGVLCLTLAACGAKQSSDMPASNTDSAVSTALPVKAMNAKRVDENPYMAKSDANIHHDGYNTDSTDEVLPLGIYPEINVSYEKTNANASPAIYFDSYGHAVVPLLGGIAIRDLNAEETKILAISPRSSTTAAVTSSRAPTRSLTRKTASSAPPATTMC